MDAVITREALTRMVERMVTDNACLAEVRTTQGQRLLDRLVAALYEEGEIELAAAIGLLHGFRVMGHHAVAKGLTALLETAAELNPHAFRAEVLPSN